MASSIFMEIILKRISQIIKLLIPKNDKNNSFGDKLMLFNFLSWI